MMVIEPKHVNINILLKQLYCASVCKYKTLMTMIVFL